MDLDANYDDNDGQSSKQYLDLPPEIQLAIIDRMKPDDRCRFSRCSKLCYSAATSSKNFIHALEIYCLSNNRIEIRVKHGEDAYEGYKLRFTENFGFKYMEYCDMDDEQLWWTELDSFVDLVFHAFEHFKKTLQKYQRIIKRVYISGSIYETFLKSFEFGIDSLYRLEELMVDDSEILQQFLTKTRGPLKNLSCVGHNILLPNYRKIHTVSDSIYMPLLKLGSEDFLRLSASKITIHIGDLGVKDIYNFIKSWQNGNIRKNLKRCEWMLDGSDFDAALLFRLLDGNIDDNFLSKGNIEHNKKSWRTADLLCKPSQVLIFNTKKMKKQKLKKSKRRNMEV